MERKTISFTIAKTSRIIVKSQVFSINSMNHIIIFTCFYDTPDSIILNVYRSSFCRSQIGHITTISVVVAIIKDRRSTQIKRSIVVTLYIVDSRIIRLSPHAADSRHQQEQDCKQAQFEACGLNVYIFRKLVRHILCHIIRYLMASFF